MKLIEHAGGLVDGPGFYRMKPADYHADPAPLPSMSSSCAKILINQTPYHAQQEHPRLSGKGYKVMDSKDPVTVGTIVHEYLTGHGEGMRRVTYKDKAGFEIAPEDYKTNAAKDARDAIIAQGFVPVLERHLEPARLVEESIRAFFDGHPELSWVFKEGHGETVMVWQDATGIWGRGMIDWWGGEKRPFDIVDIKTTRAGLDDRSLMRRIDEGIDIQAFWYARGLATLWPDLLGRIRVRLVVAEQNEPYGVRVVEPGPGFLEDGRRKALTAAAMFRRCQKAGIWPAYPHEIRVIDAPQWAMLQWEEREKTDVMFDAFKEDIRRAVSPQAPHQIGGDDD